MTLDDEFWAQITMTHDSTDDCADDQDGARSGRRIEFPITTNGVRPM